MKEMNITELQNIKVYRVRDSAITDEMIIIVEDGEIECYIPLAMEYSYFEKSKQKEK